MPRYTTRRKFLKSSLYSGYSVCAVSQTDTTIINDVLNIGVYISKKAEQEYDTGNATEIVDVLDTHYNEEFDNKRINISFERAIDTDREKVEESSESAADWWRKESIEEYEHSQLLLFTQRYTNWDNSNGYAYYDQPDSVCSGYEHIDHYKPTQNLAIHETGHNLDARHNDAEPRGDNYTLMYEDIDQTVREFSEHAKETIKENM